MSLEVSGSADFLTSSATLTTPQTPDPDLFLKQRAETAVHRVERLPLDALPDWRLDDSLTHSSGRFFTVAGVSVRTDFGPSPHWFQPIILQPEIGILGILVKRFDGVYHCLMQAKMEPGNSSPVQYATTVQATPSNYQRVHRGKPTPYLEYFMGGARRRVLVDQLLSEHSSWYLRKRNRNMIVEIPEDEELPVQDGYTWLTLGQVRRQLAVGNRVNMNARTVLSCISYATKDSREGQEDDGFRAAVLRSHRRQWSDAEVSDAMTWLIDQKSRFDLDVRRVSLRDMKDWRYDGDGIRHVADRHFQITGLSVLAETREVGSWSQPMLEPAPGNTVAFICQRQAGVLQFLVQAMVQPGAADRLELAASVQHTPGSYRGPQDLPPLTEYLDAPDSWVRVRSVQSEDGGRFLNADTAHLVIEVPEDHHVDAPENYRWMSLGLLNRFIRLGYYVNVEARSLMACLL